MPKQLTWDDAANIGIELSENHPELDPLSVRFTDLHRYVTELPDFKDDPKNPTRASWKPFRWLGTTSLWTALRADGTLPHHRGYTVFYTGFPQELRGFFRRSRIDVEPRAPFESRRLGQLRHELDVPMIMIIGRVLHRG